MDNWINVNEQLPPKDDDGFGEEYLVYGAGSVSTLNFKKGKWWSDVLDMYISNDVITHWMPLPEPPEK